MQGVEYKETCVHLDNSITYYEYDCPVIVCETTTTTLPTTTVTTTVTTDMEYELDEKVSFELL